MKHHQLIGLALIALGTACSEGNRNADAGFSLDLGSDAGEADASSVDMTTEDAFVAQDAGADAHVESDLGTPGIDGLVINEISADGDDWIELYNSTSHSISLGGLQITDSSAPETPATDHTTVFPVDFALAAGAYLVVVADLGSATREGVQTDCLAGAIPTCLEASYGISKSAGDTIFILAADNSVLLAAVYPPNAVGSGETWARIPNGTGDFSAGNPTPGAANEAP